MKRRSWQIELPHIGDLPAGTQRLRKASSSASACASVSVEALTLSIRPERPWVPLFQLSIASSTASSWWITSTGPSARICSSESVTTTATSMMRSFSGDSPVISISSQTRLFSLLTDLTAGGAEAGAAAGTEAAGLELVIGLREDRIAERWEYRASASWALAGVPARSHIILAYRRH